MDSKKINLVFSLDELAIINEAVVQLPFFKVVSLIDSINKQILNQKEKTNFSSNEHTETKGGYSD